MKSKPGTYVLILRSHSRVKAQIGRWGLLSTAPGYYIYVGSAFGSGGVQARVLRHCRETKSKHWHIDYLREVTKPVCAWYSYDSRHIEHKWAQVLSDISDTSSVKGFGCSDCDCYSHLFFTARKPDLAQFASITGDGVESWAYRKAD